MHTRTAAAARAKMMCRMLPTMLHGRCYNTALPLTRCLRLSCTTNISPLSLRSSARCQGSRCIFSFASNRKSSPPSDEVAASPPTRDDAAAAAPAAASPSTPPPPPPPASDTGAGNDSPPRPPSPDWLDSAVASDTVGLASRSSSAIGRHFALPTEEEIDVTPPLSKRAIRILLAVIVATGSVIFFKYLAAISPDVPLPGIAKPVTTPPAPPPFPLTGFSPAESASSSRWPGVTGSVLELVGNTPLLELQSLSRLTGRRILAKMEMMNPGGSVKDRAAKALLLAADAERQQRWRQEGRPEQEKTAAGDDRQSRGVIIEATGGNTGIALCLFAPLLGYDVTLTFPSSISPDKIGLLHLLGATALPAPVVPYSSPSHFYHMSEHLLQVTPSSYATHQFDHVANAVAHYRSTGPEIFRQTNGEVDGFVCSSGTGGTLAGVSAALKEQKPSVRCLLIDPPNSGLFSFYTACHWCSRPLDIAGGGSVVEGVGNHHLTANQELCQLDGALPGSEREAVEMAWWLLKEEGVWVGASAALNVCGAVKLARQLPAGATVVTVLCDSGDKYREKLYNPQWLEQHQLGHVLNAHRKVRTSLDWIA